MLVKDMRNKSTKELNKLISDLKAELFTLRFQNSTGQLDQPHKIALIKKDIARVFTVMGETENTKKATPKPVVKKETVKKEEKGDK